MDIKGTGAITDLAYNVFSLWRNKPKEMALQHYRETGELPKGMTLEEVEGKPDAMIYIHKSRNVEDCEGKWPLFYHGPSMRFLRKQGETIHILHETKLGEAPF
jgi:twinkle protein